MYEYDNSYSTAFVCARVRRQTFSEGVKQGGVLIGMWGRGWGGEGTGGRFGRERARSPPDNIKKDNDEKILSISYLLLRRYLVYWSRLFFCFFSVVTKN